MAAPNLPIPDQANTSKMQLFPEAQSELSNDTWLTWLTAGRHT